MHKPYRNPIDPITLKSIKKYQRRVNPNGRLFYTSGRLSRRAQKMIPVLLKAQKGLCLICRTIPRSTPHLDHNHKTGEVRGVLCRGCNWGLGQFQDNPTFLKAAAKYLLQRGYAALDNPSQSMQ